MTDTNYRRLTRAINKAIKNGWNPDTWPENDAKYEIDCCLSVGDLLINQSFQKALGYVEWVKLVNRLVDGKQMWATRTDYHLQPLRNEPPMNFLDATKIHFCQHIYQDFVCIKCGSRA